MGVAKNCCQTLLPNGLCPKLLPNEKSPKPLWFRALGSGQYWTRTSDLHDVNVASNQLS